MTRPVAADFPAAFARDFNSGHLSRVIDHYIDSAVMLDPDGRQHRGHENIAGVLEPLLSGKAEMQIEPLWAVEVNDVAFLCNNFAVRFGGRGVVRSRSFEVLRFESDRWRLAIDDPFGGVRLNGEAIGSGLATQRKGESPSGSGEAGQWR